MEDIGQLSRLHVLLYCFPSLEADVFLGVVDWELQISIWT